MQNRKVTKKFDQCTSVLQLENLVRLVSGKKLNFRTLLLAPNSSTLKKKTTACQTHPKLEAKAGSEFDKLTDICHSNMLESQSGFLLV